MERTISMMVGKGSLNHNNRTFIAKNVDSERSKGNKVYVKEKLQKAYDFMKQFTINGLNMLEQFLESIGERVQRFSENIGFGGRGR